MAAYHVFDDIEIICELLGLSLKEFADNLHIDRSTLYHWKKSEEHISAKNLEAIYDFAFRKNIRLNKIKEQLYREDCPEGHVILFHGAKSGIEGPLSLDRARKTNDFGQGFYCGESLEQSAMFVANYPSSSLYIVDFDASGLNGLRLGVEQDWMLMIAYFRDKLPQYAQHSVIRNILARLEQVDYIIAPIADNRMFQIIDSFIDGEITDVQCRHCLSATNLGNQYVFISQRSLEQLTLLRRAYLAAVEKNAYISARSEDSKISNDKVKIAKKQYRGQGLYIEDIML